MSQKLNLVLESFKMFLFSDEFFWNNFTHPKDSLVDLEFLFQTLGITEFNFEVSGSLVMRPTESNSILFTTTNEPIIDTWCELALGNMIFHTRNNIFFSWLKIERWQRKRGVPQLRSLLAYCSSLVLAGISKCDCYHNFGHPSGSQPNPYQILDPTVCLAGRPILLLLLL